MTPSNMTQRTAALPVLARLGLLASIVVACGPDPGDTGAGGAGVATTTTKGSAEGTGGAGDTTNAGGAVTTGGAAAPSRYKILSLETFNESLCGSIGYGVSENGNDSGIRIVLKDIDTDEIVSGYATYGLNDGNGGNLSTDDSYTCEESIIEDTEIISAYAPGYSPIAFSMTPQKGFLATVEVSMMRSCTGAPSCFDNLEIQYSRLKTENRTHYNELIDEQKNIFYSTIQSKFGLNNLDYSLQCIECDMGRGGYVKAKGTHKDGSQLELYYHSGWCSPGGGDCGYSLCIATDSDTIFNSEKNSICDTLEWAQSHDCIGTTFDNSASIRNDCTHGRFEKIDSTKRFALRQLSDRCSSSVASITYDCLGN